MNSLIEISANRFTCMCSGKGINNKTNQLIHSWQVTYGLINAEVLQALCTLQRGVVCRHRNKVGYFKNNEVYLKS